MIKRAISITVITSLIAGSSQAAVLSGVEGAVSVSDGGGFVPVASGASVGPGYRVRTGDGSTNIVYENGCATTVGPHQVAVVLATPPTCGGGGLKDGGPVADTCCTSPWLISGLIAGGGAGVAIAIATTTNKPASP
ncbi:MAG: hypothetical protein ACLPWS_02535 [Rhodomicrobium sp.]